ncbi:glycosyltransferase family 2 protein [bacterium]|nr:glycosyltransferase family 2 protein [bacterium]
MIVFADDYENGQPIKRQPLSEGLVAVILAHNDEKTIQSVIKKASRKCERCLVVDDGSDDKTVEIARQSRAEIITHVSSRGMIAAFNTAVAYLRPLSYKYAIFLSASGQHEPGDMHRFVRAAQIRNADVICGSREKNRRSIPRLTKWANNMADGCIKFKYGYRLNDPLCNYRLLSKKALDTLPPCRHNYLLTAHILRHAYGLKLRVGHLAVTVGHNYVTKPARARRDFKQSLYMSLFILFTPNPDLEKKEKKAARKLAEESSKPIVKPIDETHRKPRNKKRRYGNRRRSASDIRAIKDRIMDSKSPEVLKEEQEAKFN